jgi:hypothetical protein
MDFSKQDFTPKRVLLYFCFLLVGLLLLRVFMGLLPVAIFFFIILAPPIFVLADAQERKIKRPVLWAVFVLFTSVFGLLVYLLARPETSDKAFCPHCGGELDKSFHNCPWCGKSLLSAANCGECSFELKPGWKFCPRCQAAVGSPQPSSATITPSVPVG